MSIFIKMVIFVAIWAPLFALIAFAIGRWETPLNEAWVANPDSERRRAEKAINALGKGVMLVIAVVSGLVMLASGMMFLMFAADVAFNLFPEDKLPSVSFILQFSLIGICSTALFHWSNRIIKILNESDF